MQNQLIYFSDLLLLRDLIADDKNEIAVFDPDLRLTGVFDRKIRILQKPLEVEEANTLYFDLRCYGKDRTPAAKSMFIGTYPTKNTEQLYYINNPDGTIRWLFPANGKIPGYLSLYNSSSWKGLAYKNITRLVWSLGHGQILVSGVIYLQQNLLNRVKQRYGIASDEVVSFFTGTRGINRKVVMEINKNSVTTDFVKIALTESAQQLIQNETDMLTSLSKYDFTTLSFPTVSKKINGNARISNVKPAVIIPADKIIAIHVSALAELYAISHESKRIEDSAAWAALSTNMEFMKQELFFTNGIDSVKTRRLIQLLRKLYNSISVDDLISVSVSHGDFTPWNMYCDEQRLYVYDWELAKNGIPMLFDLFHFTFQTTILQHHKDYSTVKKSIDNWKQTPLVQQLIRKYKINPVLNFRLYLLFNVSYYLRQYINEKELLVQSQWMMDAWLEALEEVINTADNTATNA